MITSTATGDDGIAVAMGLSAALARLGLRVMFVEGDVQAPRLSTQLGLDDGSFVGLTSVVAGRDTPRAAATTIDAETLRPLTGFSAASAFDLLPAGVPVTDRRRVASVT